MSDGLVSPLLGEDHAKSQSWWLEDFATDYRIDSSQHGTSVYVRGVAARQGIGSALFRLAEARAIARGAASVRVEASLAAVEFYKANGFAEVARGETQLMSGRPIACVFMRKDLSTT